MVWLPNGEKSLTKCLAILAEYRHVTDGQTERWTNIQLATAQSMLCSHIVQQNSTWIQFSETNAI